MKTITRNKLNEIISSIKKNLIEPFIEFDRIKSGNFLKSSILKLEKELSKSDTDEFNIDETLLKIIALIKTINNLLNSNVKGIRNRLKDLTSDDGIFEKTFFELLVANYFVGLNPNLQFLETRSNDGIKTPEMIFDNSIEIECKMKDKLTSRDFKNIKAFEKIEKELNKHMDSSGNYSGIRIVFDKDIPDDAISELIENIKYGISAQENLTISNKQLKIDVFLSPMIKSNQPFQAEGIHWGTEFSDDTDMFTMEFEMMKPENQHPIFSKVYAHSYKINHPPDRINSIINTLNTAKKQFSNDKAGIVAINLNKENFKFDKPFRERLKIQIENFLNNNKRVSGIIFFDDELITDKGQYGLSIDFMINKDSNYGIPKNVIDYLTKTLRKESTFANIV